MSRPQCCRRVGCKPACTYFKPRGIPLVELEEVVLKLDELESLRLADFEGMYQEDAAKRMNISRPTFTRIIESARKKVAEVLLKGKALKLEGGNVTLTDMRRFCCSECRHRWELPYGTGKPEDCPKCQSKNIHREEDDRGWARCGQRASRGHDKRK